MKSKSNLKLVCLFKLINSTMKNIKIVSVFLIAFVMFSITSCDNEPLEGEFSDSLTNGGNNNNNSDDLLGDWRAISFSASNSSESVINGENFVTESSITGSNLDYIINFSNNQFTTNGDYQIRAITELNGQVIDDTSMNYTGVTGSGGYSTNGNTILFEDSIFDLSMSGFDDDVFQSDQTATYQFSNNGQRVTFVQNEEQTQNQAGIEITVEVSSTTVLERL